MNLFKTFLPSELTAGLDSPNGPDGTTLVSPWTDTSTLAGFTYADLFGRADTGPLDRSQMVQIPAISRARDLICPTLAGVTLAAVDESGEPKLRADGTPSNSMAWIAQPDPNLPVFQTLLWTLDDLLFYGKSFWLVLARYAIDDRPSQVTRVRPGSIVIEDGRVTVEVALTGQKVQCTEDALIRIDGPSEGLVTRAAATARSAQALEAAVTRFGKAVNALTVLKQTGGTVLTGDQITALIDQWTAARTASNGAVAFAPQDIDVSVIDVPANATLVEARNQAALDLARMAGIPADLIDASGGESLTYANVAQKNQDFVNFGLLPYARALESRLSLGDITPAGTFIRFRFDELTAASDADPTTPTPPATTGR